MGKSKLLREHFLSFSEMGSGLCTGDVREMGGGVGAPGKSSIGGVKYGAVETFKTRGRGGKRGDELCSVYCLIAHDSFQPTIMRWKQGG